MATLTFAQEKEGEGPFLATFTMTADAAAVQTAPGQAVAVELRLPDAAAWVPLGIRLPKGPGFADPAADLFVIEAPKGADVRLQVAEEPTEAVWTEA